MTDKHSPGPWEVEYDMRTEECRHTRAELSYLAGYNIDSPTDQIVGCEGIIPGINAEANARLIAAAPELLDQLRFAVKLLRPFGNSAQVQAMEAVIAKATA